jgi:hypothetical protein
MRGHFPQIIAGDQLGHRRYIEVENAKNASFEIHSSALPFLHCSSRFSRSITGMIHVARVQL